MTYDRLKDARDLASDESPEALAEALGQVVGADLFNFTEGTFDVPELFTIPGDLKKLKAAFIRGAHFQLHQWLEYYPFPKHSSDCPQGGPPRGDDPCCELEQARREEKP